MNETAQILNLIYDQHGEDFFRNKTKLQKKIKDLLKNHDISLLMLAINQNVATSVMDLVQHTSDTAEIKSIVQTLVKKYMWQEEMAVDAVNYFLQAKFGTKYVPAIAEDIQIKKVKNITPHYDKNQFLVINKVLIRYKGANVNVVVPNGIVAIGERAFRGCLMLESVVIPNSVTQIQTEAFSNCVNLTSVTIPDSVISIGEEAFSNCTNLVSIKLPSNVQNIYGKTFINCIKLSTIELPENLLDIGPSAFENCMELTKIVFPQGLKFIAQSSFANCIKLEHLEMPTGIIGIDHYAFAGCINLSQVEILDGLVSVGKAIFLDCKNLEYIVIPATLEQINHSCRPISRNTNKIQVLMPTDNLWNYFVSKK